MNLDAELLVLVVVTIASVRGHDVKGGRLEAFQPVRSGRSQPTKDGSCAAVQHGRPELLSLAEWSAVQNNDVGTDLLPGACLDPRLYVLPGDLELAQLLA